MPKSVELNRNKIAKNTLLLYFRMIFLMLVNLYTSRIILQTLGVIDFGIYNVVGGIVVLFSFFNSAMSSSTQRFLTFEIAKKDKTQTNKVFSIALSIHFLVAILILILAETIGLWFLLTQLNIPEGRMSATIWVYQLSIFAALIKIIQVPYNAIIIANEQMEFYAYISIAEVVMSLVSVFLLSIIDFDKLKLYSVFIFIIVLLVLFIYKFFCRYNYEESNYHFEYDKKLYKEMITYSGWNLFGNLSFVIKTQGVNMLLNIFFGITINSARAIAFQVQTAVQTFVFNFQIAANPQIIKSYASGKESDMMDLVFKSVKFSFYLLFFLTLPILIETKYILTLWLKIVPVYTILFTILIVINALIDCLSGPIMTSIQATGYIKQYQLVVGAILFLNLPFSYVMFKMGFPPQSTFYLSIGLSILAFFSRIFILKKLVNFSINDFFKEIIVKIFIIVSISSIVPLLINIFMDSSFIRFILVAASSCISILFFVYFIGLNKDEKIFISDKWSFLLSKVK